MMENFLLVAFIFFLYFAFWTVLGAGVYRGMWGLARMAFKDMPEVEFKHFLKFQIFWGVILGGIFLFSGVVAMMSV